MRPGQRRSIKPLIEGDLARQFIAAMVAEKLFTNFSAAELIAHAECAPAAFLLRATLRELGADTPKKVGKVLQRLEGSETDGWEVRRLSRTAAGTIWILCQVAA